MKKIGLLLLISLLCSCASYHETVKQKIDSKPSRIILQIPSEDGKFAEDWRREFEKHYDEVIFPSELKTYSEVQTLNKKTRKSVTNVLHETEASFNYIYKLKYAVGWDLVYGISSYSFSILDLKTRRSLVRYSMTNGADNISFVSSCVDEIQEFLDAKVWNNKIDKNK